MSANTTRGISRTELISNTLVGIGRLKKSPKSKIKVSYEHFGKEFEIIVNHFFISGNGILCYAERSNASKGSKVPFHPVNILDVSIIEKIEKAMTKEQFAAKFDKRFIGEKEIESLYNDFKDGKDRNTAREHFRRMPPKGKALLTKFLLDFKSIKEVGENYLKSPFGDYKYRKVEDNSYGNNRKRDISISHQTNINLVYYSSEYAECGNGDYYIIANENEVFFLERD